MKKNGFTLVELLVTIAIIGILGAISVGIIMNSVGGAKSDLDEYQKEVLRSTAELYFDDNYDSLSISDTQTEYFVFIQKDLVYNTYLEEYEDSNGNTLYGKIKIEITRDSDNTIIKVKATDISTSIEESIES